jgi:hypothetical protein
MFQGIEKCRHSEPGGVSMIVPLSLARVLFDVSYKGTLVQNSFKSQIYLKLVVLSTCTHSCDNCSRVELRMRGCGQGTARKSLLGNHVTDFGETQTEGSCDRDARRGTVTPLQHVCLSHSRLWKGGLKTLRMSTRIQICHHSRGPCPCPCRYHDSVRIGDHGPKHRRSRYR